jgi:hypothetical protein
MKHTPAFITCTLWPVFFFSGKKAPKADTAQIFQQKSSFFLKSIRQTAPRFKEGVPSCMLTGYSFNAPGKKYHQLDELGLNLCGEYSSVLQHL